MKISAMKKLIIITSFLISNLCFAQTNPYLELNFDKVVMYDYEGGKDAFLIDNAGNISQRIKKQVILDTQTTKELIQKIGEKSSYGEGTAACFNPHLGFIYYLNSKIVAYIEVCFDCNRLSSSLDLEAQKQNPIGTGNNIAYLSIGMSESLRTFFNKLVIANNFSHQLKNGSR